MTIETRLRNTGNQGGGGGSSSDSGGLASTGGFYVVYTADATLSREKILTAGSNVTIATDSTAIYINALTGAASNSGGLAGTGAFYITYLADPTLSVEKVLTAGSSVTIHTDATAIYINATTNAGSSSSGGGRNFFPYLVQQAKLYSNDSAARIDAGTGVWRLLFSSTTQQYGIYQNMVPIDYGSSPTIRLAFTIGSTISVARSATWSIEQWAWSHNLITLAYAETYGAANETTVSLAAGYTQGTVQILTIPLANIVSLNGGNLMKLRITSTGGFVGDAELEGLNFEYARN